MNDERLSRAVQTKRRSSALNDPRMSAANDPERPIHAGTVASRITFLQGLESPTTDIPSAVPRPPSSVAARSRQHRSATFGRGLVRRLGKPASSSLSSNPYQEPEVDVHHSYLGQYTSRSNHDQDHAISYLSTGSVRQQTLFERHISEAGAHDDISTKWPVKQPFGHWDPASNHADKSTLQDVNNTSFSSTKATSLSCPSDAVTNANTHGLDVGIQELGSPSSEISICTTSSLRRQSVRDLFDVYGIERPEGLVPDREPSRDLEDTPKPPRVRVDCHVCKWMNGGLDKRCRRCGHRLCKDCDSGTLPQANGINTNNFDGRATRYVPCAVPYQEDQNTTVELDGAISTPLYRCRSSDPQLERQSGLGNTSQYSHTHEALCKPPPRRITKSTPPGFTRMKPAEKLKFSHLLPDIHTTCVTSPFLFTDVCSAARLQPSPKSTNHYYRIRHHHHRENHRQHHKSHYSSDDCDVSTGCCSPHAEGKLNTHSPPIYSQRQRGPIGKEEESNDVLFERTPRRLRREESEHETVECRGYPRTGHARHSSPASNPGTVGICQHCLDDCQCIACQDTHHNVRCCVHKDHRPYLHHHTISPRQSIHTQCVFEPAAELVHEPTRPSSVRSASTVRPTPKPAQFDYSGEVEQVSNMDDETTLRLDSQKSRHSSQSMNSSTSSTPKLPRSTTIRPRQSPRREFKRKAKKMSSQQLKLITRLEKERLPPVPPLPPWAINANSRSGRSPQMISQSKQIDPGTKTPSIPRNHSQATKAPTQSSSQAGYTLIEGHSCASPSKSPLIGSTPLLSGDGSPDESGDHRSAGPIATESPYENKFLPGKALPSKEEKLRASPRPLPKRRVSAPCDSLMQEIEPADSKSNRTPLGSRREPTPRTTYSRREPCQEQRTDPSAPPERKARTRFRSPTLEQSQLERRSRIQEWQRRSRSASIGLPSRKDCESPSCEKYIYGFTESNSHERRRQEGTRTSDKKPNTSIYSSKADPHFHGRSSHQEKSLSEIQGRGRPQESGKYLRSIDIISDNYYSPIQGRAHFSRKRPKGKQARSSSAHESKQSRSPNAGMEPRGSSRPKIRVSSPESKASHASSSISRSDSKTPPPGRGNSRPESEVLCAEAKSSHLNSRGSLPNRKSHCTAKEQSSYEKQCSQSSANGDSRKRQDGPSSPVLESNPTAGYARRREDRTSEHLDKLNHVKMYGEFSSEDNGKKNQRHSRRKSVKDVVKGLEEMSSRLDPSERKTTSHWFPRFELVDKKLNACCPNDKPRPEHHLSEDEAVNGEKESREHRLSDEECVMRKRKQRSAEQQLPFDWCIADDYDDYDKRARDQDRQRPKENCLSKRCPEAEKEGVEKDNSNGPNHPDPFENIRKGKVELCGRRHHNDSGHVKDHHRPRTKKKIIDSDMPDRGKGYLNLRSGKIKRGHHGNSRASQAYQKPPAKKKERDNHGGSEHSPILQEPQTRDKESPDEAGSDDNQYYRMEEGSNHDSHDHCYEIIEKRRYGGYAKQADNHVYDYELDDEHDCVWKNRFLEKECGSDDLQSVTIVLKFTEGEDAVIEVDLRRVEE